jgi:hypothetical protein
MVSQHDADIYRWSGQCHESIPQQVISWKPETMVSDSESAALDFMIVGEEVRKVPARGTDSNSWCLRKRNRLTLREGISSVALNL